jgi:predicted alpha/beta-fold hydrolase
VKLAERHQFVCVVFNFRGAANTALKTPLAYAATATDDARQVFRHVRARIDDPLMPMYALGFSLGANIMVKCLGEDGEHTPLNGAVSISNPLDLVAGSQHLQHPFRNFIYGRALAAAVKRYVRTHYDVLKQNSDIDIELLLTAATLREFDELGTRRMQGFSHVDHYYSAGSSKRFLDRVTVPLLLLNAEDDPLIPPCCIAYEEAKRNANLIVVTTRRGGHVSFAEGFGVEHSLMERVSVEYFDALTRLQQQMQFQLT